MNDQNSTQSPEWQLIEKITMAGTREQQKSRRWSIFFKLLAFLYVTVFLVAAILGGGWDALFDSTEEHVGVVEINGAIMVNEPYSADAVVRALEKAFENEMSRAVILEINSPGGTPVQADIIFGEAKRLRQEHPDKPFYAVIGDVGASGGYYVAAAADKVFASRASLIGSIGVTAASFGYVSAMDKLGVERRVYTAGEHKAFLDPFQPQQDAEVRHWEATLQEAHQVFIDRVKEGRGERLDASQEEKLFSGLIWSGDSALELGLIDGIATSATIRRDIVGIDETVHYGPRPNPFKMLAKDLGVSISHGLINAFSQPNVVLQ